MRYLNLMAAIAVMVGLVAGPAHAENVQFFQHRTTGGCIFWNADAPSSVAYQKSQGTRQTYSWDGACTSGAPINGSGQMTLDFVEGGRPWWRKIAGTMVDGVWDGSVNISTSFYPDHSKAWAVHGGCFDNDFNFGCKPHRLPVGRH
jgi:hypothetical protein